MPFVAASEAVERPWCCPDALRPLRPRLFRCQRFLGCSPVVILGCAAPLDAWQGFSTEDAGSVITLYGKYMDNQADNGGVFYIGGVTHVIGGEYSGNMARYMGMEHLLP